MGVHCCHPQGDGDDEVFMPKNLKVACVQMTSGPVTADNLKQAGDLIRKAAAQGAQLIATPENTCHMRFPAAEKLKSSPDEKSNTAIPYFAEMAKALGVWILAGSLSVKVSDQQVANRSFLFSDQGETVAAYDKIHMFDVDLPTGETHRESAIVRPGEKAVLADTPWGKIGMTVCYDMRFPHLYRELAKHGAFLLTVPSAFTVPTGQAHWETLLRARAIECGAFVMAPAQCGTHEGGRRTYGHSLIIDPWGKILAEGDDEPGVILADLDLEAGAKVRSAIPSLKHDKDFTL